MQKQILTLLVGLLMLAAFVSAGALRSAPRCVRENTCTSKDWVRVGRAGPEELVRAVVAVHQNNMDVLQEVALQISDPDSPKYGRLLTFEQIGALTKDDVAVEAIRTYFSSNGAQKVDFTLNGEFAVVTMTVEVASRLLQTQFHSFSSAARNGQTLVRALEYTIPAELEAHVDLIADVAHFPTTLIPRAVIQAVESPNAASVTPAVINRVYNVGNNNVKAATQSLFESLGQSFSPADLTTFQNSFNLPKTPVSNVIGNNNPNACKSNPNNCGEANLDVQYIIAVANSAQTTYWSVSQFGDIFLNWILAVANTTNPPLVHSISYGSVEPEESPDGLQRFDQEALKLGARGVTVVVATGDDGVANFPARSDPSQCAFNPSFPATATNVIAVGATQGPESGKPEVMCSSKTGGVITSGGGFSTVFSQTAWSGAAIKAYFASGVQLPPSGQYVATGRGYPDVALLGFNYNVVLGGQTYGESGTSASTPVFAAFLTLANDARISAGKSPLGNVGQALYKLAASNPSIFNDVTVGENNCCAGEGNVVCCPYGFYAAAGWDPTTGWGSVNFKSLLSALVAL